MDYLIKSSTLIPDNGRVPPSPTLVQGQSLEATFSRRRGDLHRPSPLFIRARLDTPLPQCFSQGNIIKNFIVSVKRSPAFPFYRITSFSDPDRSIPSACRCCPAARYAAAPRCRRTRSSCPESGPDHR